MRAEDLGEDDDNEFADQPLRELHFVVDELDYQAITAAIAARQTVRYGGTLVIADGQEDLGGQHPGRDLSGLDRPVRVRSRRRCEVSTVTKRLSVAQYEAMIEHGILPESNRWELIEGKLVEKMTKGGKHSTDPRAGLAGHPRPASRRLARPDREAGPHPQPAE